MTEVITFIAGAALGALVFYLGMLFGMDRIDRARRPVDMTEDERERERKLAKQWENLQSYEGKRQ